MTDSNSDGYAGQRAPTDTSSEFNAISFLVEQIMGRISTMKLVQVQSVTTTGAVAAVGFVDVLPLVSQIDGDGNSTPHAVVRNVPYTRMQGGTNAVIMDPKKGDIGWMAVADRDSSAAKAKKGPATPGSFRRYNLADGVYMGGILNGVPQQYVQFQDTGITIADKNNNKIVTDSTGISINGMLVNQQGQVVGNLQVLGNLQLGGTIVNIGGARYSGSIDIAGTIKSGTTVLSTHVHTGVATGGGTSGPPQ